MSEVKNTEKTPEKKKEKTTIKIVKNTPFTGDLKTNLVSSIEMAEVVSSLFGTAFADYYGCKICINNGANDFLFKTIPAGMIYVELYFKDRGAAGSKIKNLTMRGQSNPNTDSKNTTAERVRNLMPFMNPQTNNHVYSVTHDTYEALEEFMPMNGNINWGAFTQEISTNMGIIGSKEEAVVCITGLSLDKILSKIYGTDTEDGKFEYATSPATMIPARSNEFIMQVIQLDKRVVRKLERDLGLNIPANSQFHVYR